MKNDYPLRRCAPSPLKGDDGLCWGSPRCGAALAGRLLQGAAKVLSAVTDLPRDGEMQ